MNTLSSHRTFPYHVCIHPFLCLCFHLSSHSTCTVLQCFALIHSLIWYSFLGIQISGACNVTCIYHQLITQLQVEFTVCPCTNIPGTCMRYVVITCHLQWWPPMYICSNSTSIAIYCMMYMKMHALLQCNLLCTVWWWWRCTCNGACVNINVEVCWMYCIVAAVPVFLSLPHSSIFCIFMDIYCTDWLVLKKDWQLI